MIEEQAVITGQDENAIYFKITATGACDACSIREACFRNDGAIRVDRERLECRRPEPLEPGSRVTLRVPQTSVLGLTALVYGVPLVAFLAGILLGHSWLFSGLAESARALASFGLGAAGLAAAGLASVFADRRMSRRVSYEVEKKS